jgi:pimeloyl-ACP methyl ester carboxylesterase
MADYHLVGFDPRGVGASAPLACDIDLTAGPRLDLSPDSEVEWAALDRQARTLAERCDRLDGSRLAQLGTESVVRDLELLRQAVGDPELHYLGLSYGTLIGLRYAERYPRSVGHMVLDGVVDPSFGLADLLRQQADEFERALLAMDDASDPAPMTMSVRRSSWWRRW